MNGRILFAVSFITIAIVAIIATVAWTSLTVQRGLRKGDWITYSHNVLYQGWTVEPDLELDWFRIDVLDVDNNIVSFNLTSHLINGTEAIQSCKLDLSNGNMNCSNTWSYDPPFMREANLFILPNLRTGDSIPSMPGYHVRQEQNQIYSGTNRTVIWTKDEGGLTYAPRGAYTYYESYFFWDKQSGIFVEWQFWNTGSKQQYFKILETNIW